MTALQIKEQLSTELEKRGHSLADLEDELTRVITKTSGVGGDVADLGGAGLKLIEGALGTSLALAGVGGSMLGGTGLLINRHLNSQDSKFNQKQQEIDRLRSTMDRIRQDHSGLLGNQHGT